MADKNEDFGEFDTLVESYDGYTYWFELGYHATFRFWRSGSQSGSAPHPFRYELVLHEPSGVRMMGFDNAHPIRWKSGKFNQRSNYADHWHRDRSDKGRPYTFVSMPQLLEDFFQQIEKSLNTVNVALDITGVTPSRKIDDE